MYQVGAHYWVLTYFVLVLEQSSHKSEQRQAKTPIGGRGLRSATSWILGRRFLQMKEMPSLKKLFKNIQFLADHFIYIFYISSSLYPH